MIEVPAVENGEEAGLAKDTIRNRGHQQRKATDQIRDRFPPLQLVLHIFYVFRIFLLPHDHRVNIHDGLAICVHRGILAILVLGGAAFNSDMWATREALACMETCVWIAGGEFVQRLVRDSLVDTEFVLIEVNLAAAKSEKRAVSKAGVAYLSSKFGTDSFQNIFVAPSPSVQEEDTVLWEKFHELDEA